MQESIKKSSDEIKTSENDKVKNEKLLNDLYEVKKTLYDNDKNFAFHEQLVAFAQKLRTIFTNYSNYELYHFLVGSTVVDPNKIIEFDFPGEYSVEKFLKMSDEERKKFIQELEDKNE